MRKIGKILSHPAIVAAFVIVACSTKANERIEHVQRVFMHDVDEYSFMVLNPETGEMRMHKRYADSVTLVRDVPEGEEMWVHYRDTGGCGDEAADKGTLIIHLRYGTEVEGAGWNRGKSGKGATQPIE